MADIQPQPANTFQLPANARVLRRRSQDLGLQIAIHEGHAAFVQNYVLGDRFGAGGFGHVHLARRISDNRVVVVKEIRSERVPCWCQLDETLMPVEVVLLALCQGLPGVVQFFDAYNLGQSWVLVMDRVSGSTCDMFDYIGERGTLPEPEAAHYFHQLIGILLLCHRVGVLHRDIKDENLLIDRNTRELVLIDFGSGAFLESRLYTDFDGTRVYCPPEWILSNAYDGKQAEVWSLGVLLYDMLCGDIPFVNDKGIISGKLRYRKDNLSKSAKDLIGSCLNMDPGKRPTLLEILEHPWMAYHRPNRHDKQPRALLSALDALDRATFELQSCGDFSPQAHSQLPSAFRSVPPNANSGGIHNACSPQSSYSSSSSLSPTNVMCHGFSVNPAHAIPQTTSPSEMDTLPTSGDESSHQFTKSDQVICSTASLQCPRGGASGSRSTHAFPFPVYASSPNTAYAPFLDDLDPLCVPILESAHSPDALRAIQISAAPATASPCARLHSNESGYYSRSDSLSSTEGRHLMTTTVVNGSRTCSTSSHANSVMSVSNVVMAHTKSRPVCPTSVTSTQSIPHHLRDGTGLYAHCWRSGGASMLSSNSTFSSNSSSPQSSKSSPPDPQSVTGTILPITAWPKQEQRNSSTCLGLESRLPASCSFGVPSRKINATSTFGSSSASAVTASATNAFSINSTNSVSQPVLPAVSDGVDRLYQFFAPAIPNKPPASPLPLNAWFVASHTTRG